jgi:predicted DNA-binding transcriptional regulator AlpA
MPTIYVPSEDDIRRWIKEAVEAYLNDALVKNIPSQPAGQEQLLCRKEIAGVLGISLVTLHDWMNRGLPCHKQRGRVYFIRSEVLDYVKANHREADHRRRAA